MTKKHFIALADFIKRNEREFNNNQIELLADFCGYQNTRFNRSRWLQYIAGVCGKNGGKVK